MLALSPMPSYSLAGTSQHAPRYLTCPVDAVAALLSPQLLSLIPSRESYGVALNTFTQFCSGHWRNVSDRGR